MGVFDRLKSAFNIFSRDPPRYEYTDTGPSTSYHPDRKRLTRGKDRTIVNAIYNRIAVDCASVDLKHVRVDENGRYLEDMNSGLNYCLTVEANIDQTARQFLYDTVLTMLDEGSVCIVPVNATENVFSSPSFDVRTMRVGTVKEWFPEYVRVELYNDRTGHHEEIKMPKRAVSIVQNPFFTVMNEPNSIAQRLIRKLTLMDSLDEETSSGKLRMIVQMPYTLKSELRHKQAEQRRREIEKQLTGSKYGIAYTDGTEHITQLNQPIENNLMEQVEYLTSMLYSQLGITQAILDGTADEQTLLNYYDRLIEVIMNAIADEMKRKWLTKTARSQGQTVMFFRDPFKLVPVSDIAQIADTFTRNEILTSNEIRQIIGMKPSLDPNADQLRNKNIAMAGQEYVDLNTPPMDAPQDGMEYPMDEYGELPDNS